MDKRYYFLGLLFCWLLPWNGYTQMDDQDDFGVERIMLHTDRELYISGENIWFGLYVLTAPNGPLSDFSKVGYLELISQEGTVISRVKVALEGGKSSGTIKLPDVMSNGYYTLRAYTQGLRNIGEQAFGEVALIVLNPGEPLVRNDNAKEFSKINQPALLVPPDRYLNIEIQPSQHAYSQRSMVTLEITTKNAEGRPVQSSLSLSAALASPESVGDLGRFQKGSLSKQMEAMPLSMDTIIFPAETQGMQLRGKVVSPSNVGEEAEVYLSFPGSTAQVYLKKADRHGQFSFLLPKLYGLRQMVIQVRTKDSAAVQIELADEFQDTKPLNALPFFLPSHWASIAKASLINAQVQKGYEALALPQRYRTQNPYDSIPFFGRPDVQYFLDDYNRFPLPEFFFEIVPEVRVRGKYGSEELKVLNEWESEGEETPPLLLVDGVPVFDQRTFLKINNQLIKSTEVVATPFWINPVVFDGIVQLSSFEGDARCFTLPETALRLTYLTLLPEQEFVLPDHSTHPDSRLPDFRTTLYWNPTVQTDKDGKAIIRFFTSDALGNYAIRVEGVADNGRFLGSAGSEIQVVKDRQ